MNSIMMVLEAILLGSLLVMSAGAFTTSTALSSRSNAFQKAHDSTTFLFSSNSKMPYDDDKMRFYALGLNLGQQVGGSVVPILKEKELDICLEAFGDQLRGTATQDARTILETFGPQLNQIIQERANLLIDGNKKAGEAFQTKFLEDNPDAVKQESGLIYLETEQGKGESPTIESMVEVDYHGTLACGTVIDSSIERGQPMNFPLKDVIKGWGEGLQLMKEGGKATLVIPSDLAYGDGGSQDVIPGGSTLKFDVELIHVSTPTSNKVELPDGSTIRLPEGVKVRMVDPDEE